MPIVLPYIARNWWLVLLRGVCAVLFGILAFAWPGITLAALIIAFGAWAIIDGVSAIAAGISGSTDGRRWWQMIAVGVLSLAAGILTFAWPGVTAVALLAVIAAWLIIRGVMEIVAAIRLRAVISHEWLLILAGLCSVVVGVAIVVRPRVGALAVIWLIGAEAIVFGILLITLAFGLRSFRTPSAGRAGYPPATA
jgi:uncharacterized membrane protein HdeD (DUF308 family)